MNDPKIQLVQVRVEQVRQIMHDNIDKALLRGDQLDELDRKAHDLEQQASLYERQSRKTKCLMMMKNYKCIIFTVIILIISIVIIALIIWSSTKN